jgi:hypothetical protein
MADEIRLVPFLAELLDVTNAGPPSAAQLDAWLQGRATARTVAGPNLAMPAWAREVGGAADVYLAFEGDVDGVHLHEDPRGWGASATLHVRHGTLDDVESVVGPTDWMSRNPDDFSSGERVAAYVDRSGWTVRVFTELAPDRRGARAITLSYPSRETPPRSPDAPRLVVVRTPVPPPPPPRGIGEPVPPPPPPPPAPVPLTAGSTTDAGDRCPRCGADTTRAGSFCGTCGAFLEWSREADR